MKILPINDLFSSKIATYMYKILRTDHYDSVLKNKLQPLGQQHDYETRSSSNLLIPRFSRERSKADIYYIGVRLWNTIPQSIKI